MQVQRLTAVAWLAGCTPVSSFDIDVADPTVAEAITVVIEDAAPAFDPVDGTVLSFAVKAPPAYEVALDIRHPDATAVVSWAVETDSEGRFSATWDGRTEDGQLAAAGPYEIFAEIETPDGALAVRHDVSVVRAAFETAWAEDDEGISADRHLLYWAADAQLQDPAGAFAHLDAIEVDGTAQDLPAVTEDFLRASDGDTEPVAYTWDSRPLLSLAIGTETVLGSTGLDTAEIDVALDGWTVLSGNPLAEGVPVTLQADDALVDGPGILSTALTLRFTTTDDSGQTWAVGDQQLPIHLYMTMGPSGFDQNTDHYRPWAIVLEESLDAIDGAAPEDGAVLDSLVEWIFNDLGLVYDTESGASFYSEYAGWQWDRPHFYLGDFLQRKNGSVINCSDAANILSAYANMSGVPLQQLVILENFDLNPIKAIGGSDHTNCPFGPWGCAFSYHAVTSTDGGQTIWDATLALDGDADPTRLPSTELLVQSTLGDEYLARLVRSGNAAYTNNAVGTLQ